MIPRAFILALALSQGDAANNSPPPAQTPTQKLIELGLAGVVIIGLVIDRERMSRRHQAVIDAKDAELRALNEVTRDVLVSDTKAIDAFAGALKAHTDVITRHFK